MAVRRYFLGANTSKGFYSVYEDFCKPDSGNFLYVIKGGPGCGKSSFMKTIGKAAEDAGLDVEYVLCSADPDGTSPHVLEVALPAASGAYVDLGQFYNVAALRPKREALAALTEKYRAQYAIAYKALAEAKRLHDELEAVYNPHVNFDGVYALAKEHILRLQTEN